MASVHLRAVSDNSPTYSEMRAAYDKWLAAKAKVRELENRKFPLVKQQLTDDAAFALDLEYRAAMDAELAAIMEYERVRKGEAK